MPYRGATWWWDIGSGSELGVESVLIVRPALMSEKPAKWYIDDGSGRALALLQRILRYGEIGRTAWVYIGDEPDGLSDFIKKNPELICTC
jgi:hypothetical protein